LLIYLRNMVKPALVGFGVAVGSGYYYYKSTINEKLKSAFTSSKEFVKKNPKVSLASSFIGAVAVYKAIHPYMDKAWNFANFGMELTTLARQIERSAAERDSDNMSKHSQQWTEYALKTAIQMNKQSRQKLEEHYNISEIRAQLKEKNTKEEKLKIWNRLKIATFTILLTSHFQTVFVWLKSRLIFSICFRWDYQKTKQDQMVTGPSVHSTGNDDKKSFVASLTYLQGDDLLREVVEQSVLEILGKRALTEQLTCENYIQLLENIYTLINKQIFESSRNPKEFFIAPLVEREEPAMGELAEMEGELHMILDNPDSHAALHEALTLTLNKITSEAQEVFAAFKKKKGDKIFLANLISETRTLTKTLLPILSDLDVVDPENPDQVSSALQSDIFDDFFNVISNIK